MTNLGICYAQPFWFDGETYTTNNTSIVFPLHFGRDYFDQIHLFVPFRETTDDAGPLALNLGTDESLVPGLDPERVSVHPLPFRSRTREWYSASALGDIVTAARTLHRGLTDCDLVWMPAPPHVPTILCYGLCQQKRIPSFLYVRSDQEREIEVQEFSGLISLKQQLGGWVLPLIERHIVEHVPTIVAGPGLYDKHEPHAQSLHTIRAVHLSEQHLLDDPVTEAPSTVRLLYVGRLVPVKGVNHLVTAVEDAVEEGCDVLLDIVGTGKEERALREQVATTSVSSRVSFHGFVPFGPELFELYRQADAFVLLSYSEGFPNVLLESMANGTPVITTNVGGIDEVIVDGETGLLVDPGNTDALTDAIIRLATDDELYSRLVHAGLDTAHQYTVEQQEQKLVDVLKKEFPDVTLE